jgi:hypothetical protein
LLKTRLNPILAVLVILAATLRLINGPRPYDDAFITFRYVENITNGIGFVYNAGEYVLGTTTPLYTLLLALLHFPLKSDLGWIALLINTVADCTSIILLYQLGRKFIGGKAPGFAYAAPLLFAVSVFSTNWCIGGMETSLFSCLLLLSFYLAVTRQTVWGAFSATLATLCRPEGILIAGLVLVAAWVIRRGMPWREFLVMIATGAPWALFATLYFGSPIPHSITAKGDKVYIFAETGLARFKQFSLIAWDNPIGQIITAMKLPDGKKIFVLGLAATIIFLALALAGIWRIWKVDRVAGAMALAFPLLLNGAYVLATYRDVLIFDWYLVPLVSWYLLLTTSGLYQWSNWGIGWALRWFKPKASYNRLLLAGLVLYLAVSLANQMQAYDWGRTRMKSPEYYREAAQIISARLKPTDTIIAPEIGMLGYYANARIFDSVGLISPGALKYYPVPPNELASNNAIPTRMVNELNPEYVISLELFVRNSLNLSQQFKENYTLLQKIPTNTYGSDGLLIYIRKDLL